MLRLLNKRIRFRILSGDGHEAIDDDDDDAATSSHMELDSAVTNDDGDVRVYESERSE
ncbi:predicted protein [Arabidopsis lyrata subsp. lyrata]|uniref:Predicted protein n=1 Tax=Arabidopsis lyrata subsp. lyrata TaxID=81972 RepID=D7MK22_ARALL|nr:predicted protein [Arabidopsis lyrata subsp. lyrata]